jgi:rRNA maturation endonuclease Nob1
MKIFSKTDLRKICKVCKEKYPGIQHSHYCELCKTNGNTSIYYAQYG